MGRGSRSLAAGAALWLVAGAAAAPSMRFPAAEWTSADPLDLGVDPVGLQHALAYWRMATGAHGIDRAVVARRGVLVHEGEEAATPQDVRSVTKSFSHSTRWPPTTSLSCANGTAASRCATSRR